MPPLVLITGTSSGIGLATAVACAEAGFEVIATMRNLERRGRLDSLAQQRGIAVSDIEDGAPAALGRPTIHVEKLDVRSALVDSKVRELLLKYGPIEAVVNNAGIAVGGVFEEQSDRDVRDQFETNVLGMMAVTRAVLPSMRAGGRGRIVNLSSLSGRVGLPGLSVYAATKHAVSGFSAALRHEVSQFGIFVCVVEPGTFKTDIFYRNQRRGEWADDTGAYAPLSRAVKGWMLRDARRAPGPEVVGQRIAQLLKSPSPAYRTVIGRHGRLMVLLRQLAPGRLGDRTIFRYLGLPP